jgi:branched-chain amino acid transport system permease protein
VLVLYPFVPFVDWLLGAAGVAPIGLERQLVNVFIFGIVALALNLQVGYAGLLQLGIAAFVAIGAYTAGIFTVAKYPFQIEFWAAIVLAPVVAGLAGLALGGPTLRLRGDYLALVTLGFAEVVRVVMVNLESITDGPRGLNPLPEPWLPQSIRDAAGVHAATGRLQLLTMYYVALACLAMLVATLYTMEKTALGRRFVALREDELASACMGLSPVRTKLVAFAVGAAIAGLGGALYATNLTTTAEPNTYDFNYSIMVLCCVIIGGLGSLRGALLGALVLVGFDNVVSPLVTRFVQSAVGDTSGNVLLTFSNWRWLIFGVALVLMMRLRPEGLWPSARVRAELREEHAAP